jgi:hypothetical protein
LVELNLHLSQHLCVGRITLALAIVLHFLELVNCLLELYLGILKILLRLLLLSFQEFKFAFPQRSVFVIVVDLVL